MATVALDQAEKPFPSFASFVCSHLPIAFLRGVRPLIDSSCESAFEESHERDGGLPYWKNVQPHERNRLAFERIHQLADELGLSAVAKTLENGYYYLEIESKGLTLHVKHLNNYQTLKDQMVKADYRRQMTTINAPFGQMPLFPNGQPTAVPEKAYAILFYADGATSKSTAGNIFFVLPSNEEGNLLATCEIEETINAFVPSAVNSTPTSNDVIELPSKNTDDEEKKAN
jgi:hypothetical protein